MTASASLCEGVGGEDYIILSALVVGAEDSIIPSIEVVGTEDCMSSSDVLTINLTKVEITFTNSDSK